MEGEKNRQKMSPWIFKENIHPVHTDLKQRFAKIIS